MLISASLLSLLGILSVNGQTDSSVTVTVAPNQNVREIAREYLGNPDLWEDILRVNGLKSPADVLPGMTLKIPVQEISQANRELGRAAELIRNATHAGGRLFAPDEMTRAVNLSDSATEKRRAGDWNGAVLFAKVAVQSAEKALEICREKSNVSAEAVLYFKRGNVQSRRSSDLDWKEIPIRGALTEGAKIRTLSKSYAELLFRDESRLKLEENSQALIRRLRANLLENSGESSVSLIEGNVLALLGGGRAQDGFKLEVPGVQTRGSTQEFWVSRTQETAKFANYDGELELAAGGAKVTLKENQGSVVRENERPTPPRDLLPPPTLTAPADGIELFQPVVDLAWQAVEGAKQYTLEVAEDNRFSRIVVTMRTSEPRLNLMAELADGRKFWRVTPHEPDGMRGRPSRPRSFIILHDAHPPYVAIRTPADNASVSSTRIAVAGTAEPDAQVTLNGRPIHPAEDGAFEDEVDLEPGRNRIEVKAVDRAGNVSTVTRTVIFTPASGSTVTLDAGLPKRDGALLASPSGLTLRGNTTPNSRIDALTAPDHRGASAYADGEGRFSINIPPEPKNAQVALLITAPDSAVLKREWQVEWDSLPPVITFEPEPPAMTAQRPLPLTGALQGAATFTVNGVPVAVSAGRFQTDVPLKAGINRIICLAFDEAGNVATAEREILFDPDPPKLVWAQILPPNPAAGQTVTVKLKATDAGQLTAAAPFKLTAGLFEFQGALILQPDGIYTATLTLPRSANGKVALTEATLTDYLGNRARVKP